MTGLVLKDLLVTRKTLRSYVLFLIFYANVQFLKSTICPEMSWTKPFTELPEAKTSVW